MRCRTLSRCSVSTARRHCWRYWEHAVHRGFQAIPVQGEEGELLQHPCQPCTTGMAHLRLHLSTTHLWRDDVICTIVRAFVANCRNYMATGVVWMCLKTATSCFYVLSPTPQESRKQNRPKTACESSEVWACLQTWWVKSLVLSHAWYPQPADVSQQRVSGVTSVPLCLIKFFNPS